MMKKFEAGTMAGTASFQAVAESWKTKRMAGCGLVRISAMGALAAGLLLAAVPGAAAQTKLGPAAPVSYDNKFEVYGGLNFMNFQAGQNLPKRMNLGGAEIEGTYWLTHKWGAAVEYRGEAGTTPVFSNTFGISRPLVYMNMGMAGAQYRGPKNQFAAMDFHAYGGVAHGVFDGGTAGNGVGVIATTTASGNAQDVGLYSNRTKPIFALGGSLDLNRSKNWAVRLSPDLILEHFGTETREFFAISGGIVYRIGKK